MSDLRRRVTTLEAAAGNLPAPPAGPAPGHTRESLPGFPEIQIDRDASGRIVGGAEPMQLDPALAAWLDVPTVLPPLTAEELEAAWADFQAAARLLNAPENAPDCSAPGENA